MENFFVINIYHIEKCPLEYSQNCGRLDTLEQELCIKYADKCPLYDLGFGE